MKYYQNCTKTVEKVCKVKNRMEKYVETPTNSEQGPVFLLAYVT